MLTVRTGLTCGVSTDPTGLVVLRPTGVLSLGNASALRRVILKHLADQPRAIIVELTAVSVADDLALTVFSLAAQHAAAWPGVPIVLSGAAPSVAACLRRMALDRQVVLTSDLGAARAYLRGRAAPRQVRQWFPAIPTAIAEVRAYVLDVCRRWRLTDLVPVAALVVSELVTNAVRYGDTPTIQVVVTRQPRYLCLAVWDGGRCPPKRTGPAAETDPGGRGLLIVDAFASNWGYTPTKEGKVTWATLSTSRRPNGGTINEYGATPGWEVGDGTRGEGGSGARAIESGNGGARVRSNRPARFGCDRA
jgi:anti-anti-sigma regulatory factor/anti-sigma regulatory factor (Ser/Thr protein kinase)